MNIIEHVSTGAIPRPEFEVAIYGASGRAGLLVAAPLFAADPPSPDGRWCLTHSSWQEDDLACLAEGPATRTYQWFVHCGAETELLACCAVSQAAVVRVILASCQQGGRPAVETWIDAVEAMNLKAPAW